MNNPFSFKTEFTYWLMFGCFIKIYAKIIITSFDVKPFIYRTHAPFGNVITLLLKLVNAFLLTVNLQNNTNKYS